MFLFEFDNIFFIYHILKMKITSWNVNGLRSPSMCVYDKNTKQFNKECNLYKLVNQYDPDIICFGETKCQIKNQETYSELLPFKYSCWNSSVKKLGYSGVSIHSKYPFKNLGGIPGLQEDEFGRHLLVEFDNFILCNVYAPNSGGDKDEYRRDYWDVNIHNFLKTKYDKPLIYCGDLNIVHTNDDIYDITPLKLGKSPGTKSYERTNFKKLIDLGYYDAHRYLFPVAKLWTWWDVRSRARLQDKGWRLDYFLVSDKNIIKDGVIHKDIYGSDHCPISLELKI